VRLGHPAPHHPPGPVHGAAHAVPGARGVWAGPEVPGSEAAPLACQSLLPSSPGW